MLTYVTVRTKAKNARSLTTLRQITPIAFGEVIAVGASRGQWRWRQQSPVEAMKFGENDTGWQRWQQ